MDCVTVRITVSSYNCICSSDNLSTFLFVVVSTCPHLQYPANGSISTGNNTSNTTVKFSCDYCYVLVGRVNLTCQINGQWDGNPPLCTGIMLLRLATTCRYGSREYWIELDSLTFHEIFVSPVISGSLTCGILSLMFIYSGLLLATDDTIPWQEEF